MSTKPRPKPVDRDRLLAAFKDVHPGLPSHTRLDMIFTNLVHAIADEIEGKRA